ncbi:hypothetical protein C8Q76DRAFT_800674 [Earliella scabrosa]|nr:hypothetical protein C8Q76DRAFT_800674 [Earliella scabrosa]
MPAQHAGDRVSIQIRTHIWIPGKVLKVTYQERFRSYVYDIEYVAADGCRHYGGFFPRDVAEYQAATA